MKRHLHPKVTLLCAIALLNVMSAPSVIAQTTTPITAAPDGIGTQVQQQGNQTQISGGTRSIDGTNLFHSFQRFGLSTGQIANFLSTPGTQNILGRIVGGQASLINGQIQVSGGLSNLYLLNPAGIVFGANASLNVPGSFNATTATGLKFNDQWWGMATNAAQTSFLNGHPTGFGFLGGQSGTVINAGNLQVQPGQGITLLGGQVISTGTIAAPEGQITIAAVPGEQFVRVSQSGSLLSLELPTAAQIDQTTLSQPIQAATLPELLTGQDLGNTGVQVNGDTATIGNATIPTGSNDAMGRTLVAGDVSVAGVPQSTIAKANPRPTTPGQIDILGQTVGVINAEIDASGTRDGGSIRIGGDYQGQGRIPRAQATTVNAQSQIRANAGQQGNGGQVIVWADGQTKVQGKITAQGGRESGDGGLVETSGKLALDITGSQVSTSAPNGNGGTWLLDPTDIDIVSGGAGPFNSGGLFDPPTTGIASQIDPTLIETAIDAGTNVVITTNSGVGGSGDILVQSSINQTGASSASLTITGRHFAVANGSTINLASTGALNLNLNSVAPEAIAPTSSVQAAIDLLGTTNGSRTINLNNGTYQGGTLLINKNVTISGNGSTQTILSGENLRSVISVTPGSNVTLRNLAVQNGQTTTPSGGGGILNSGTLTLDNITVQQNQSTTSGGGIFNTGILTSNNSQITNNNATANGGGIANTGQAVINTTNITTNQATGDGGGVWNEATGQLTLNNSQINSNQGNRGGGIFIQPNTTTTINQGSVNQNNSPGDGGGIFNDGILTINQLSLTGNTTTTSGGGIFNRAQLQANDAVFTSNQALLGGGLFNAGVGTVDRSTFVQNTATGDGGGIRVGFPGTNAQLTLSNSEVRNNSAAFGGGLEASENAIVNVENTRFLANQASDRGGAFQNDDFAQLTINQSTIVDNSSTNGGGGGFNFGSLTVTNSTFSNNQTPGTGGGLLNDIKPLIGTPSPGQINISNVTLSGNQANTGGGFQITQGNASLNSTTIANNRATSLGGGINQTGGNLSISNTIVATNIAPNAADTAGQFSDQGNNLIGDSTGSTGFTNSTLVGTTTAPINPLLAPLGSYGGNTQTQTLLPGSPAIDQGNSGGAPATDQRGLGRVSNADIGAVESQGFTVTATSGTPQTTLINTPFPAPLTVSVTSNSGDPVDGGVITFTPPTSGASITSTATTLTISGGQATIPAQANDTPGPYQVSGSTAGVATPETFDLINTITPIAQPIPANVTSPPAPPTTPTPTTVTPPPQSRFARGNCDVQSIGGRLAQDVQDWQLRVGDRAEIARLLDAGQINAALQAIAISESQRQTQDAYLNPQVMPIGCAAAKLNDLKAETRPALIYTFAQAKQLDMILVTAGQSPKHIRLTEANAAALNATITAAKQGKQAAKQQLYRWLISPFKSELQAQAIETIVFSLDRNLAAIPLNQLSDGQQTLSQQFQIRTVQN